MEYVLQTEGLSKRFGGNVAVKEVNMHVKKGDIYGLIGENGAGKTTIMRMVVGLAKPSKGTIKLFGSDKLVEQRKKIGCVIENPAIYPNMTARENLETFRKLVGENDPKVVDEILKTVGLEDTGKKKAKNFSLGMKQRLSIGIALLGNPEFLILDEPINGLDPTGIAEVRDLILKLHDEGKTILLSSHILGELFKVATCYGVIRKGELVEEFSSESVYERCKKSIKIVVDNKELAKNVLGNIFGITDVQELEGNTLLVNGNLDEIGKINVALCKADVMVSHVSVYGMDLEEYFINMMRGDGNEKSN